MKLNRRFIHVLITSIIVIFGIILTVILFFTISASKKIDPLIKANKFDYNLSELIHKPLNDFPNIDMLHYFNLSSLTLNNHTCGQITKNIKSSKQTRIIGASDALPHSQPWIVSLRIYKNEILYDHFCSGSLLTTRHVLTSAHCVQGLTNLSKIIAVTGLHLRTDVSETSFKNSWFVAKTIIHSHFNQTTLENDLAILELSTDVKLGENVSVICLPSNNTSIKQEGTSVVVAGWGNNEAQSANLQQVNLTLLRNENSECYKYLKLIDLRLVYCAVDLNKVGNICSGDR